jgi:hypothetical protein
MIGAHWPTLLVTPTNDRASGTVECRLERALAAAGAVAWELDIGTGESQLAAGTAALLTLKDDPALAFCSAPSALKKRC